MRDAHAEYRTVVEVGELTVTGTLPGTSWRPEGGIAIGGDVRLLWRGRARELAVALLLVADRLDAAAAERYGATRPIATTGGLDHEGC